MDMLLAALMLWIAANSDYSTEHMPLPRVVVMTAEELTREYYTDSPQLLPTIQVDERVLALYAFDDDRDGTIYLRDCRNDAAFDTGMDSGMDDCDDPAYQERLLHELVHHVQRLSGATAYFSVSELR